MTEPTKQSRIPRWYAALMAVIGAAIAWLTYLNFAPALSSGASPSSDESAATLPAFDYRPWHGLAVQDGRVKPFQSACVEAVRKISGTARFEKLDPTAIVLSWMLLAGRGEAPSTDWENYPFILCRHRGLRVEIFGHLAGENQPLTDEQRNGKRISPADLRSSPGFDRLLVEVANHRQEDPSKAHFQMTDEQRTAEEVIRRLVLFDALCGRTTTKLFANRMVGQQLVRHDEAPAARAEILDPIHIAALDTAPNSAWFSLTELREIRRDKNAWRGFLEARIAENPQAYLRDECRIALHEFQQQIAAGNSDAAVQELDAILRHRRDATLAQFRDAHLREDYQTANKLFNQVLRTASAELAEHARQVFQSPNTNPAQALADATEQIEILLADTDEKTIARIRRSLELAAGRYSPDDPAFRVLHLEYLETRFPDVYLTALDDRAAPEQPIADVLAAFEKVRAAFTAGDEAQFHAASQSFFELLSAHSASADDGDSRRDTISIELTYNRTQPFLWSWIVMLAAAIALLASTISGNTASYLAGLALYIASLVLQLLGFLARIYLSGRAPVGNIYETVIWAALMSAVLALVLELIYRRRVIALAGAIVATFGLILADQLPLALDPQISQLAPVLRTNYWLTIHVITIVSSYAAGTLAWGLGNITLGILALGRGDRETLKMLSHFTYRAIQITVLLLATGTFLGGWWAAESWGRFWGWDPKEVSALIALICYVVPLHARYIGWVKDFGLALSAVLCYASIIVSWYVVNFVFASGLHSYGFGGSSGMLWVLWAALINVEWLLICCAGRFAPRPASVDVADA